MIELPRRRFLQGAAALGAAGWLGAATPGEARAAAGSVVISVGGTAKPAARIRAA